MESNVGEVIHMNERPPESWHEQRSRLKAAEPAEKKQRELVVEITASPPQGWCLSQEAWDATPESIKSETARVVRELTAGIEKYRPASERDASLEEFH
jgi:hypothetical protein